MKIVIDINDEMYSRIMNSKLPFNGEPPMSLVWAIKNGAVLPKGHGELIDKDVVLDMMNHGILEEYITTMGGVIHADR